MLVLIIIIVLVVLVGLWFVSTQRSLVNLDELCKNALSQIEVQLNSRFDAVIALAKTAAQYAKHVPSWRKTGPQCVRHDGSRTDG